MAGSAEMEVEMIEEMLSAEDVETLKDRIRKARGTRVMDVIEQGWLSIRTSTLQRVLSTTGDHFLDADSFGAAPI